MGTVDRSISARLSSDVRSLADSLSAQTVSTGLATLEKQVQAPPQCESL